ncbi:hypothetical protein HDU96_005469 [Phlyctochytrium bullatum]|nr:hypothetical protein HDU96_005469 [Phlyctochytrium bullatum]
MTFAQFVYLPELVFTLLLQWADDLDLAVKLESLRLGLPRTHPSRQLTAFDDTDSSDFPGSWKIASLLFPANAAAQASSTTQLSGKPLAVLGWMHRFWVRHLTPAFGSLAMEAMETGREALYQHVLTRSLVLLPNAEMLLVQAALKAPLSFFHILYEQHPSFWTEHATIRICREPNVLPLIHFLHSRDAPFSNHALLAAAKWNNMDLVRFLHQTCALTLPSDGFPQIVELGHLEMVAYLHSHGMSNRLMESLDVAVLSGRLEMAKFVGSLSPHPCSADAFSKAAGAGDLEMVRFLHYRSDRQLCFSQASTLAAQHGHYAVLKFLVQHRAEKVSSAAFALADRLDMLRFLWRWMPSRFTKGLPRAMRRAVEDGDLKRMQFLSSIMVDGWDVAWYIKYTIAVRLFLEEFEFTDSNLTGRVEGNGDASGPGLDTNAATVLDYVLVYPAVKFLADRMVGAPKTWVELDQAVKLVVVRATRMDVATAVGEDAADSEHMHLLEDAMKTLDLILTRPEILNGLQAAVTIAEGAPMAVRDVLVEKLKAIRASTERSPMNE